MAPNLTDNRMLHIDGSYGSIVRLIESGVSQDEIRTPSFKLPMKPRGVQLGFLAAYNMLLVILAYYFIVQGPDS